MMRIQEVVNGTVEVQVAKQAGQEIEAAKEVGQCQNHQRCTTHYSVISDIPHDS